MRSEKDIEAALERISAIAGILGVSAVAGEKIRMKGELPPLVSIDDREFSQKISRDSRSRAILLLYGPL
jgi:hypothetical protein